MYQKVEKILKERTLVLIKPDAVKRGLIGEILQRLERTGIKIVACKMLVPTREQLDGHFPKSEEWVRRMGEKTLETYREYKIDPTQTFNTSDPHVIGKKIREWNYHYLTIGPVMVMILEGIHVIDSVRKLIGHTLPYKADAGTIRGDFSINAPDLANLVGSACKNLIHASGTTKEAKQEINNWFNQEEIMEWKRTDEFFHFILGEFTEQETGKEINSMQYAHLEEKLNSLREETDYRGAAEYAYVLAVLHKENGDSNQAIQFGREAINLFDKCQMNSMEECAARNVVIEGIALPDLIHQDVVRNRLQPIAL